MAAGLAHELNNPASAAARSAKLLGDALIEAREAWRELCAASLTGEERDRVEMVAERSLIPVTTGVFSALERSDREEELVEWLDARGADLHPASTLAETGITTDVLDELGETFTGNKLDVVLRWVAAEYTARTLTSDVERAAVRIHDLVSAVKRFAYVDRAAAAEPTSVEQGLVDTVAVLATKAKAKSVAVRMNVQPGLPKIPAHAGELNQVWANLIDNAIDAVATGGEINVHAQRQDGEVVVRVIDDGPGIPPDIQNRIFDPFFTTKPIGQGTGLGLDIVMSVVRAHNGKIAVDTKPGRTEFRVALPTDAAKPT
jgi:signal transduction histidine kinase